MNNSESPGVVARLNGTLDQRRPDVDAVDHRRSGHGRQRTCRPVAELTADDRQQSAARHRTAHRRELHPDTTQSQPDNLPSIEDRGQTDRVTTPTPAALRRWPRPRHAARLATLARS